MSKGGTKPGVSKQPDLTKFCRSTFTLTFAVEVLGLEVWEDCKEENLDQGSCVQGMKIQYQLYPGNTFDLDVMIWPHTAKIWHGAQYGWVRTWLFLERRWLAFSISHAFPVRVADLKDFVATVNPTVGVGSFGSTAKNDREFEVCLPPLGFGVRRYFAPVLEATESLWKFVQDFIWELVERYIPWTCFDEIFDVPHLVTDVRHQDACLDSVRDLILSRMETEPTEEFQGSAEQEEDNAKHGRDKAPKKKVSEVAKVAKVKFEIKLSGEAILSGTGRIVQFETVGDRLPDSPEIIVLISSNNLPAQDDLPIVFLNVENLCQIPLNELKILRTTHLYTKWTIGEEEHCSDRIPLKMNTTINFNDHRALPIPLEQLSDIVAEFLDNTYKIELRGIRSPGVTKQPKLFGYEKGDRDFGKFVPKLAAEDLDFLIAVTKIDARRLSKGVNSIIKKEYPLYPPDVAVKLPDREGFCTNDINFIRAPVIPNLIVPPDIILKAQMSLEVSIGVVGCTTHVSPQYYSRMYCSIKDSDMTMKILRHITDINDDIIYEGKPDDLMSGFALDTGNIVVLFLEGPKDGYILRVWELTEDFYPNVKPMFSCSDKYSSRIYPELLAAAVPFIILKMFLPLGVLLACPPVYARPALPLPTRSAVLKIGRLVATAMYTFPTRCQLPTAAELKSFRLELCVAPRPTAIMINNTTSSLARIATQEQSRASVQSVSRINWDK